MLPDYTRCGDAFQYNRIFSKQIPINKNNPTVENHSHAPDITRSTETAEYVSRVYNECVPEWVNLKGQVTYSVKEMKTDSRYFILYMINLTKVEGTGETTGAIYKGGGIIKNKVNANLVNGNVNGMDSYKVRYKSTNSTLTITEKAHFVHAGGTDRVSFGDSGDSCK